MPCDGVAQGLEVEAVLAAEAAWEQWDSAASMAGCFNMDLDLPQHLPEGGDGSISAPNSSALNKVIFYPFCVVRPHPSAPLVL